MNYKMYLSFFGWIFMKMFKNTFDNFKKWRDLLRNETGIALLIAVFFTVIGLIPVVAVIIFFIDTGEDARLVILSYLVFAACSFVYNVIKTLWQCFQEDRKQLFDTLRR